MKPPPPIRPRAFTLVEILLAVTIFMMMMGSIMACWKAVVNGTETGERAAALAQRARITMRELEDSLNNMDVKANSPVL